MAQKPFEQDIILDAEGKPVFEALARVQRDLNKIVNQVQQIQGISQKSIKQFSNELGMNVKAMQTAMGQIRTIAGAKNAPGFAVQDMNANRRLAKATTEATTYGRTLAVAANAADALQAKLNEVNKAIAKRGSLGYGETLTQTKVRRGYEEQIQLLRKLDAERDRIDRRRARTPVTARDEAEGRGVRNGIDTARAKLEKAALAPNRVSIQREIDAYRASLDAYDNFLGSIRGRNAERISEQRRIDRELKAAEDKRIAEARKAAEELARLRSAGGIDDRKAAAKDAAAQVRGIDNLNAARTRETEHLARLREARRAAITPEANRHLTGQIQVSKAYIQALDQQITAENRASEAAKRRLRDDERGKRPGANSLSNILSPRYIAAAAGRTAVYAGAASAMYGVFSVIQGGLQFVVEFQDELAKLSAIADATPQQMQKLKASILDVATASRFSTIELVKITQTLAQSGVTASQMEDVLRSVTTLATASGSTPDEAVNLVTSALGSFQLQASEAGRVADLMASALNRTKLTVQQVGQAIQYVGATAFEQNIGLEQMLATVGAIAQAGVKSGSTIGTGFRQFLVDLQTPSEKLTEQLGLLGLKSADVDVTTRGLPQVLETLKNAGFGAAQAYSGLETRAAAFYLTAKNNIDVIDLLQLSFNDQNAAVVANERAMNSLTAQWQRFKNLIGAEFSEAADGPVGVIQNLITWINNLMEKERELEQARAKRNANGTAAWYEKDFGPELVGFATEAINWVDRLTYTVGQSEVLVGDWLNSLSQTGTSASRAMEELETRVNEATEAADIQRGKIGELEKEYQRLLVQKSGLIDNDVRSAAEMQNLMNRFEGLSGYLTNTKNLYTDLTNAVLAYTAAQRESLAGNIATQQSALATTNQRLRVESPSLVSKVRNSGGYNQLTAKERAALQVQFTSPPGTDEFRRAAIILADAATRLSGHSSGIGAALNELASNLQTRQANNGLRRQLQTERNAVGGSVNTQEGRDTFRALQQIGANITLANPLERDRRDPLVKETLNQTNKLIDFLIEHIPKATAEDAVYFRGALADARSHANQLKGLLAPTKDEKKASEKAERDRRKAEREEREEAQKVKFDLPLKQSDIKRISGKFNDRRGNRTHKGVDYAANEGSPVYAPADASVEYAEPRGAYGNIVGLDFGAKTQGRYAHLSRFAVKAGQRVTRGQLIGYSGGREGAPGSGRSTGPHLHEEILVNGKQVDPKSARLFPADAAETFDKQNQAARRAAQVEKNQLSLDEENLKLRLQEVAKATTIEAFHSSVAAAQAALDKVNLDAASVAEAELLASGGSETDPEHQARMRQVSQEIAQNNEDFQNKIAAAITKNLKEMLETAEANFAEAMRGAELGKSIADAQVSGLGYESLDGRVPEYVRQAAQSRAAQADENVDRTRAALLPSLIEEKLQAIAAAKVNAELLNKESEAYAQANIEIRNQTAELISLRGEKISLDAALSAGAQIPTRVADGLRMAIDAYQEANVLNRSFTDEVIFNMGDGIAKAHESLTGFFTDVMTGSKGVLSAFGDMVMGMLNYLQQLAAQFVANQIFNALLNAVGAVGGAAAGAPVGDGSNMTGGISRIGSVAITAFDGGKMAPGRYAAKGFFGGGKVANGHRHRDSVSAELAKDEWVINSRAAASVGDDFMNALNKRGAAAVQGMRAAPTVVQAPMQKTNVYVVAPDQKPSLGPNDVLVTMQQDLLNGESRKLVKAISQGG